MDVSTPITQTCGWLPELNVESRMSFAAPCGSASAEGLLSAQRKLELHVSEMPAVARSTPHCRPHEVLVPGLIVTLLAVGWLPDGWSSAFELMVVDEEP